MQHTANSRFRYPTASVCAPLLLLLLSVPVSAAPRQASQSHPGPAAQSQGQGRDQALTPTDLPVTEVNRLDTDDLSARMATLVSRIDGEIANLESVKVPTDDEREQLAYLRRLQVESHRFVYRQGKSPAELLSTLMRDRKSAVAATRDLSRLAQRVQQLEKDEQAHLKQVPYAKVADKDPGLLSLIGAGLNLVIGGVNTVSALQDVSTSVKFADSRSKVEAARRQAALAPVIARLIADHPFTLAEGRNLQVTDALSKAATLPDPGLKPYTQAEPEIAELKVRGAQ